MFELFGKYFPSMHEDLRKNTSNGEWILILKSSKKWYFIKILHEEGVGRYWNWADSIFENGVYLDDGGKIVILCEKCLGEFLIKDVAFINLWIQDV